MYKMIRSAIILFLDNKRDLVLRVGVALKKIVSINNGCVQNVTLTTSFEGNLNKKQQIIIFSNKVSFNKILMLKKGTMKLSMLRIKMILIQKSL
jgi:hypothetical protein